MGLGIVYRCEKCNEVHGVMFGSGYNFPAKCLDLKQKALNGEFGKNWKQLMTENGDYVIDATYYLYYCKNCGNWEMEPSLSVFGPKYPENSNEYENFENDFREWSFCPWDRYDRKYKLVKRYRHTCSDCGNLM
ncbi:MAG: hypothetical protein IKF68_03900, partial [Erysipelotrichaceae bacterium]|nr:hypothetical protein [Erysipelotrichaceae bacterium]